MLCRSACAYLTLSPVPARSRMLPRSQALQRCARAMVAPAEPTLTDLSTCQAWDSVTSPLNRLRYVCSRLACAYLMSNAVLARPCTHPEPLTSRREARAIVLLTDAYYTHPCTWWARRSIASTQERSKVRACPLSIRISSAKPRPNARLGTRCELLISLRHARATMALTERTTLPTHVCDR